MAGSTAVGVGAVRRSGRKRRAPLALVLLAVLLQACSSASSGAPGNEEPAAVVLTRSMPANGALGVARNSQMTFTFSGALDAATVSTSTVSLRCLSTFDGDLYGDSLESLTFPAVVPVTVSYDAPARTITVAPRTLLATRRNCVLATNGLRDTRGRAVAASVSFRTVANPVSRRVYFDAVTGNVRSWTSHEHDAVGNVVREFSHPGSGSDGEWFTADDDTGWRATNTYDAAGNRVRAVLATGPGADSVWYTDDDLARGLTIAVLDDQGRLSRFEDFYGPGPDGLHFTADDVPAMWAGIARSPDGDVVTETTVYPAGPDGVWFTSDDQVQRYDAFTYDAPGGRLLRQTSVSDAGPDGVWLTGDDVPEHYHSYGYDSAGAHSTTVEVDGPGADGVWFTADDSSYLCERVSYDDQGRPTRFVWYHTGQDQTCFTPDDEVSRYRELSYAPNGSVVTEFWCFQYPGPDGQWFTSDDPVERKFWFDPTL